MCRGWTGTPVRRVAWESMVRRVCTEMVAVRTELLAEQIKAGLQRRGRRPVSAVFDLGTKWALVPFLKGGNHVGEFDLGMSVGIEIHSEYS